MLWYNITGLALNKGIMLFLFWKL